MKQRREEREREQAWLEEEKARMQRHQEDQQHAEWERNADKFHLEQAKIRSKIRLKEGRARPIDILAKNLIEDDMEVRLHGPPQAFLTSSQVEMTEPYKLFKGLQVGSFRSLSHPPNHFAPSRLIC